MMEKQELYLRKANRSLRAATLLFDAELFDVAISRAYYTMFYVASAMLLEKGLQFSKHSAVVAAFGQHFVTTGLVPKEYHRILIHAEDERNVADYVTGLQLKKADAAELIERAKQFIELGEKILGPVSEKDTQ
ncbi:HEPN domain-containing protein [bacterium]|nr:HEPN domain-containing protein [bacterium]MBU1983710.1 HEPN domain-containing protein [bacterium]